MQTTVKKFLLRFITNKLLFLTILLVGVLLRIWMAYAQPLWLDEAATWYIIRNHSWTDIIFKGNDFDPQPPGHYLVIKFFSTFLGDSELALRFPVLLLGILLLPLSWHLSKQLHFKKSARYLFISLLSLSPILTWYSAEARMYMFALFFQVSTISSMICLINLSLKKTFLWTIAWMVFFCSLLFSLFSSASAVYILPTLLVILIFTIPKVESKKKLLFIAIAMGLALASFLGWFLPYTASEIGKKAIEHTAYLTFPGWKDVITVFSDLTFFRWRSSFYSSPIQLSSFVFYLFFTFFASRKLLNCILKKTIDWGELLFTILSLFAVSYFSPVGKFYSLIIFLTMNMFIFIYNESRSVTLQLKKPLIFSTTLIFVPLLCAAVISLIKPVFVSRQLLLSHYGFIILSALFFDLMNSKGGKTLIRNGFLFISFSLSIVALMINTQLKSSVAKSIEEFQSYDISKPVAFVFVNDVSKYTTSYYLSKDNFENIKEYNFVSLPEFEQDAYIQAIRNIDQQNQTVCLSDYLMYFMHKDWHEQKIPQLEKEIMNKYPHKSFQFDDRPDYLLNCYEIN